MSKHTPAPWSLPHFAEPGVNCQCGYVLTADLMGAVCTVHASGDGDDWQAHGDNPKFAEAVANAHLIAASPDMLEALRTLLVQVKETSAWDDAVNGEDPSLTAAVLAAEAAIAKADGQS